MEKKLMVIFSDNADYSNVTLGEFPEGLSSVSEWIKNDVIEADSHEKEELEYMITFKWMTQQEIDELPEL